MNRPTIADLGPDHIPGIMSIQDQCGLSSWSEQGYKDEFGRLDSVAVGAVSDGELLGFIVGRITDEEAEVHNLGVLPGCRRVGIGSALLAAFVTACKNRGSKAVWLEVRASNKNAIEFYIRHGFAPSSIRKGFYRSPDEDALIMVRDLGDGGIDHRNGDS